LGGGREKELAPSFCFLSISKKACHIGMIQDNSKLIAPIKGGREGLLAFSFHPDEWFCSMGATPHYKARRCIEASDGH
jgi:hypothetical protein